MPICGFINNDLPGTVVTRCEPVEPPQRTPAESNVRPTVDVYPQHSPEAPRYGDVQARPARVPVVTFQAVAQIESVMEDMFSYPQWAPNFSAAPNYWPGGHNEAINKWRERSNIERRESMPYGSGFELSTDDQYGLLMGARG